MTVDIYGYAFNLAGTAVDGATAQMFTKNTTSQVGSDVTTGAGALPDGAFEFNGVAEGVYDIKVTSGSSVRWRKYDDEIQLAIGEFGSLRLRGTNAAYTHVFQGTPTATRTVTLPDATGTALLGGYANTSTGVMSLTSTANSAAAVYLRANGGTSETIKIHSDQGTSVTEGAESVNILSDAGGVGIRSTANLAKAVNITSDGGTTGSIAIFNDQGTSVTEGAESISVLSDAGGIGIRSTANLANAVNITVDGGTTSTMTLFNDQGTAATEGAASIQLLSDVGGINIKSGLNAADAILLTADGGTSEKIRIHADQGTGVDSIELSSDAGGIELNVDTNVGITGSAILDENNMASDSDIHLATQQSIKAYVDASPVGDITNVIAGAGMTGGSTSGEATLNVIGGDGIAVASDAVAVDLVSNGGLEFSSGELRVATGISQYDVAQFAASVADNDFLRIDGTAVEGRSAAEVLSDIGAGAAAGSSSIVTTGALDAGSITSNFGTINNGSSTITTTGAVATGALTVTGNIIGSGDLYLDAGKKIIFDNDGNDHTYIYQESDDDLHIHVGGVSLIQIDQDLNATTGALSFGNTSPGNNIQFRLGGAMTFAATGDGDSLRVDGTMTLIDGVTHARGAYFTSNVNTQGTSDTIPLVTQVQIDEPNITKGSGDTVTLASSLYIAAAPTEGATNAAIYVAGGDVMLAPTAKLYLDSGGNTYIYEESDDDLHIVVGGVAMIEIDQDGPITRLKGPVEIRNIAGDGNSAVKQTTGNIQGTTSTPVNLGYDLGAAGGDTAFIYVNNMRMDTGYWGNGDLLFVHDNEIVLVATVGDGKVTSYAMSGGQVTIAFSTGTWDTNWWILDGASPD